jgi:hypothetical protein
VPVDCERIESCAKRAVPRTLNASRARGIWTRLVPRHQDMSSVHWPKRLSLFLGSLKRIDRPFLHGTFPSVCTPHYNRGIDIDTQLLRLILHTFCFTARKSRKGLRCAFESRPPCTRRIFEFCTLLNFHPSNIPGLIPRPQSETNIQKVSIHHV